MATTPANRISNINLRSLNYAKRAWSTNHCPTIVAPLYHTHILVSLSQCTVSTIKDTIVRLLVNIPTTTVTRNHLLLDLQLQAPTAIRFRP